MIVYDVQFGALSKFFIVLYLMIELVLPGEFQGPALLAILEGASLSRDEVASLQFLPPWSLRGDTLNYGLGLLSCFSVSDLPSIVSDGFLYMLDPRGLALATPSNRAPVAKSFSLRGILRIQCYFLVLLVHCFV